MPTLQKSKLPYLTLPRGGYLVETSAGAIQFGAPPETIKDTMVLEGGAPEMFVLPAQLFHYSKGISVAELEFPIYYNFFIRKKCTHVICTMEQHKQMLKVLQESLLGPELIDLRSEYLQQDKSFGFPDIRLEMDYFRGGRKLEDHVFFSTFDENDSVQIDDKVEIRRDPGGSFLLIDHADGQGDGREVLVPGEVEYHIIYETGESLPEPFQPPLLGVTALGTSSGFDPKENTSGFILWINGHGVMVDPPVNSTEWLRHANVNPRLINSIILSHCHADHDAGTLQKILEEGRVTIYTTETVLHSFLRKYNGLTGISVKELYALFDFVPVIIDKSFYINGAEFRFKYALHAIPSLRFDFFLEDQSFAYTSDHLNDPEQIKKLYEMGVLTDSRYRDLIEFPWNHTLIYHEAGIPPLHTSVDYLNSLPQEVQKRIVVYHMPSSNMPEKSSLRMAKFGIENTVTVDVRPPEHEQAYRLLDILGKLEIFRDLPIARAKEFLNITEKRHYNRSDLIIERGTQGNEFYIIVSGNVSVSGIEDRSDGAKAAVNKQFATYEYFGEASLILDQLRAADVRALTDVEALIIPRDKFLNFIRGSDIVYKFKRLNEIRRTGSWELLSASRFLVGITSGQKTQLELLLQHEMERKGSFLIRAGKRFPAAFFIQSGEVEVLQESEVVEVLSRGDFCGELYKLQKNEPASYSFRARSELRLYRIERDDMIGFISDNPGVYMRLNYLYGS